MEGYGGRARDDGGAGRRIPPRWAAPRREQWRTRLGRATRSPPRQARCPWQQDDAIGGRGIRRGERAAARRVGRMDGVAVRHRYAMRW